MEVHRRTIDISLRVLTIGGRQLKLPLVTGGNLSFLDSPTEPCSAGGASGDGTSTPMSELEINGETQQPVSGTWVAERDTSKGYVVVVRAVVCPGGDQGVCMRVINPTMSSDIVTIQYVQGNQGSHPRACR